MKTNKVSSKSTSHQHISLAIFILLLIIRLADYLIPKLIFRDQAPDEFIYWLITIVYTFIIILVWLNRDSAQQMNIDQYFIHLLVFSGLVLILFGLPETQGIFVGLATAFIFLKFPKNIKFDTPTSSLVSLSKYILLSFILLAPFLLFIMPYGAKIDITSELLFTSFLDASLFGVIFEEILFRGILWMYLKKLGFHEKKIILVQGILFWISHHNYLLSGQLFVFFFTIPVIALLFGILVYKSKSLTPSTVAHFVYNMSIIIAKNIP